MPDANELYAAGRAPFRVLPHPVRVYDVAGALHDAFQGSRPRAHGGKRRVCDSVGAPFLRCWRPWPDRRLLRRERGVTFRGPRLIGEVARLGAVLGGIFTIFFRFFCED